MAIVNRDLAPSQQIVNFNAVVGTAVGLSGAVTGAQVAVVPAPMQFMGGGVVAKGISGAPNLQLWCSRFIAGAGHTQILVGASLAVPEFGLSGGATFVPVTSGITYLQAGDVLSVVNTGANTATVAVTVTLALKALQDIKQSFGVSL